MKQQFKKILVFSLISLLSFSVSAATLDSIVAVVNDNAITQSQLNGQIGLYRQQLQFAHAPIPVPAVLRTQTLQHIIDTQLQEQLAKKEGITVSDAAVTQAIAHISQQNGLSLSELKVKVEQQGMNYEGYRADIKKQILISNLQSRDVAPQVQISAQEITDFLRQNGNRFVAPVTQPTPQSRQPAFYHVIDILIPFPATPTAAQIQATLVEARSVLTKLHSGATINVQSSDLSWRTLDDLPNIFAAAVQTMQPGSVSAPIRAPNGYHILQLVGVRGGAAAQPNAQALPLYATHVRHILIKTTPLMSDEAARNQLARLRVELEHGSSFAALAKAYSQDPGSASKGGDLGWINPGMLDPVFEKVMNNLKPGTISEPFKSSFGWHLVEVIARKSLAQDKSLLRQQARAMLYERKFNEALQNWLLQLRSQSYVKIMAH